MSNTPTKRGGHGLCICCGDYAVVHHYPNGDDLCLHCGLRFNPEEPTEAFQDRLDALRTWRMERGFPVYNLSRLRPRRNTTTPIPD